jgi:uncharacterized DUF497 family protein
MKVSFDPVKRAQTLKHRGLDFADAGAVFTGRFATLRDDRKDYGEVRFTTAGFLSGRLVVVVWTPRDGTRRIISMRYAHEREADRWQQHMEGPG